MKDKHENKKTQKRRLKRKDNRLENSTYIEIEKDGSESGIQLSKEIHQLGFSKGFKQRTQVFFRGCGRSIAILKFVELPFLHLLHLQNQTVFFLSSSTLRRKWDREVNLRRRLLGNQWITTEVFTETWILEVEVWSHRYFYSGPRSCPLGWIHGLGLRVAQEMGFINAGDLI